MMIFEIGIDRTCYINTRSGGIVDIRKFNLSVAIMLKIIGVGQNVLISMS